ncbi:hypothetical protein [Shewanella sp. KCT]|uniref:hypothetical protein n=1 Tax=Shewanella sp. KCT TaxID=2569535 RepID=UPI0011839E6E|nr:hypothetical protein [Shewanella sp. KCT]
MDFFGIGAALKAAFDIYFAAARHTGRSNTLADSVSEGDLVLFATHADLRWFRSLLDVRDPNRRVKLRVWSERDYPDIARTHVSGKVFMDHRLVEKLYDDALSRCAREIAMIERRQHSNECSRPNRDDLVVTLWRRDGL